MPYLNTSKLQVLISRYQSLPVERKFILSWLIPTVLIGAVYLIGRYVMPENPIVFRYFLGLYFINSALLFAIYREYRTLGKTLVVFLFCLEAVVSIYYGLTYFAAGTY